MIPGLLPISDTFMLFAVNVAHPGGMPAPLRAGHLREVVGEPGALWREIQVVPRTASTNHDLMRAAADSDADGVVLLAEHQTSGRGRLGRTWVAPPRSSLIASVLLRPSLPEASWGWIPLLAALAVRDALREVCGLVSELKWPNDVLLHVDNQWRKTCGILVEVAHPKAGKGFSPAVVIGTGINVTQHQCDLPVPEATSLRLAGSSAVDRTQLACSYLNQLQRRYRQYCASHADPRDSGLWQDYADVCQTIGQHLRMRSGDRHLHGQAVGVDETGALLLRTSAGIRPVAAGEVVQVRQS